MDGTLVDSTPVVEAGWGIWTVKHNLSLDAILAFSHGRPGVATMEHFLPGRDHEEDLNELAIYEETHVDGVTAVPGAKELLSALGDYPWAIVTSAWRTLAEARIKAAGLPMPKVLISVDDVCHGKPSPEGFLKAAEQLGIEHDQSLVFEDTRPGIEAGLSAGMQVIGLLTTVPAAELQHDILIPDFRAVTISYDDQLINISIGIQEFC